MDHDPPMVAVTLYDCEQCEISLTPLYHGECDAPVIHTGSKRICSNCGDTMGPSETMRCSECDGRASPSQFAVPIDTSLAVADYLAKEGIGTTRTPVGDVYVAAAASEPGVAFGGEPSGAWIWPGETLCPDGPLAACKVAALAAERPLADRATDVETYPIRRTSVEVPDKAAVMDRVREAVAKRDDEVSTLDGVRVDRGDGWFLLRASGTQPLVRVTAEARDSDRAEEVFAEATAILDSAR